MTIEAESASDVLTKLRGDNVDITGAVLATGDGFVIAADTGPGVSDDMLAALAVDLITRASRTARQFEQGGIQELYARAETGQLITVQVGPEQVLACLANPQATLGLLLADVRNTARKLAATAQ